MSATFSEVGFARIPEPPDSRPIHFSSLKSLLQLLQQLVQEDLYGAPIDR